MKRYLSILALFFLWTVAIYFLVEIIFTYLGYMLQIQNRLLTFLQDQRIILAPVIAVFVSAISIYKKWNNETQLFTIKRLLCYSLGFSLLSYGLTKIYQTQFIN